MSTKKTKRVKHVARLSGESTVDYFNRVVDTNEKFFTQGNVITSNQLCTMFGIDKAPSSTDFEDVQAHNFAKLNKYTGLNKVLAYRGLVLCSRKYYKEFHVMDEPETKEVVKRTKRIAKSKANFARTLKQGAKQYKGDWSSLNSKEKAAAAHTFSKMFYK